VKPARLPRQSESLQQLAARLTADDVARLVVALQRSAHRRGDATEAKVLAGVLLWLGTTSAVATAVARRLRLLRCPHCHAELTLGEAAELVARVQQVAP